MGLADVDAAFYIIRDTIAHINGLNALEAHERGIDEGIGEREIEQKWFEVVRRCEFSKGVSHQVWERATGRASHGEDAHSLFLGISHDPFP